MPYPAELTTSAWVDHLAGQSRDDQVATLATFHRRVEHAGRLAALTALADAAADDTVRAAAQDALNRLPPPVDYVP